jgi:hypothetical protein
MIVKANLFATGEIAPENIEKFHYFSAKSALLSAHLANAYIAKSSNPTKTHQLTGSDRKIRVTPIPTVERPMMFFNLSLFISCSLADPPSNN